MGPKSAIITAKIAKGAASAAQGLLTKLLGPGAEEAGLLLKDSVQIWRLKNQVRILARAKELLDMKGIEPSQIPLRTLVPIMEGAALEENCVLAERWACLIANASAGNACYNHPAFPRLLTEMTPDEARFLDELNKVGGLTDWPEFRSAMLKKLKVQKEDVNRIFGNLDRLGLCQIAGKTEEKGSNLSIREFGKTFLRACSSVQGRSEVTQKKKKPTLAKAP